MKENNNLICPVCGLENSQDYSFCKNCGTPLDGSYVPPDAETQYTPPPNYGNFHQTPPNAPYGFYNYPFTDYSVIEPELEGVDTRKVQAYVGNSKQNHYMQIFIAIKKLGRKIFISWPVALLGAVLGLTCAAGWFFYRKMYRIGIVVCLCGLLLSCFSTAATYSEKKAIAESYAVELAEVEPDIDGDYSIVARHSFSTGYSLITSLVTLLTLGGVIFFAAYGNYYYYKNCTSRIKKIDKMLNGVVKDSYYYSFKGRPSIAAAILFPLVFLFFEGLITMIPYFSLITSEISMEKVMFIINLIEGVAM